MNPIEFEQWMDREVHDQRLTPAQRDDLLEQKAFFENQYPNLQVSLRGKVVGFARGRLYSGNTVHEVLDTVKNDKENRGRMLYFEPIGFDII